ncbi:MAG: DUF1858 domain-containing protein [bacterium]
MAEEITGRTIIGVLVRRYPQVIPIFARYGMGCVECSMGQLSNLEKAAKESGIDLEKFLSELNQAIR